MKLSLSFLLLAVGLIHLLPVMGLAGGERLASMYGVGIADPNLELLMRHRAVLFGMLGGVLVWSAFAPSLQPAALLLAAVSVVSFLALAEGYAELSAEIHRVVVADWIALACLAPAAVLLLLQRAAAP